MDDQRRSPPDIEILETTPGPDGSRRLRLIVAVCCVLLVAAAVGRATDDAAVPPASSSGGPSPLRVTERPVGPVRAPAVRSRGLAMLDLSWLRADTNYDLFVRTNGAVYRVQPQISRAVRTPVPAVRSGPVSFVPIARGVVVDPLDSDSGYLIPDDGQTQRSSRPGGLISGTDRRYGGTETGDSRIVDGELIAAGPTRLMVRQCDPTTDCRHVVLDSRFEPLEPQPRLGELGVAATGVISPDGRIAALTVGPDHALRLVDLIDGTTVRIDLRARSSAGSGASRIAFSPDSRWAFVAGSDYRVHAVEIDTGTVRALLQHATAVEQVVVRP